MTISGYDCWKRKGLSRRQKLENVGAETTSSGSSFQIRGPETLKVRLPTVDSQNIGTTRRLELAERSARQPCSSATQSSGPRYRGAVSCRTLYVSTTTASTSALILVCYRVTEYILVSNTHALTFLITHDLCYSFQMAMIRVLQICTLEPCLISYQGMQTSAEHVPHS